MQGGKKSNNERILEERRKYAEEMARKFYKNHKREESSRQSSTGAKGLKGSKSDTEDATPTTRTRRASLDKSGKVHKHC